MPEVTLGDSGSVLCHPRHSDAIRHHVAGHGDVPIQNICLSRKTYLLPAGGLVILKNVYNYIIITRPGKREQSWPGKNVKK